MTGARTTFFGILIIAAAVAMAHVHILFGGQTPAGRHLTEWLPALDHLSASISAARIPEWWDGIGLGVPFAADSTNLTLYPPAWLVAALPVPWAADLLLIVHAVLAGAGAALLARRMGAGELGAPAAGAAFATGGAITALFVDSGTLLAVAWMPWIGWSAIAIADARDAASSARAALVLAVVAAAQLHAGGIEAISASALMAAGIAMARSRSVAPLLAIASGFVAALLLSAWVILPELLLGAPDPGAPAAWSTLLELLAPLGSGPAPYIGAPVIVLAAVGAWQGGRHEEAALAVALALLAPLLGRMFLVAAALVLCVLAGQGLAVVLERRPSRRDALVIAGGAALYGCVVVAIGIGSEVALDRSIGAGFVLGLTALAIAFTRDGEGRERYAVAVLAAALVGHLVADTWAALPRADRAAVASRPTLLPEPSGPRERIYRSRIPPVRRGIDLSSPAYQHQALAPNTAARFGYAHLRGVGRHQSQLLDRAWRASAVASERLLDLYDVGLALVPASVVVRANLPVVSRSSDGSLALVKNERRRPRAFVATRWRFLPSNEAVIDALFPPAGPAPLRLGTVHLIGDGDGSGEANGPAPALACAIEPGTPEVVGLECPDSAGGYVVLLDAFAPGWSATVDGEPAEIERVDLLARGVKVGAGRHHVELRYRTPGLRLGALVAVLAWLNLVVLVVLLRRLTG